MRERRHSIHSIQDGKWPTIEEHDPEAEEVEEEIPVATDQENGKNVAIKLFQQFKSVDEKHNKKEELIHDESESHLHPKKTLSKLINQFEDNISNSNVSPNLSYSSPVKPSVDISQDRPKTICQAQVHSAPKEEKETEVFCSLSVANRIKMLDNLNTSNNKIHEIHDTLSSRQNRTESSRVTGSVAARILEIESMNDAGVNINETNNQQSPKLDLSAIKYFRRPSVPESYEDIQYLRALVNSQSNTLSCSTQRLDRIELNFEKVYHYALEKKKNASYFLFSCLHF